MSEPALHPTRGDVAVRVHTRNAAPAQWNAYLARRGYAGFHLRAEWMEIFERALHQRPWFVWAERDGDIVGVLPLMHLRGWLFGSFLVSQPYLNTGGVLADSESIDSALIDSAVGLADSLDVKHLELRHERPAVHARLGAVNREKVHMRLPLPATEESLWNGLKSKLRSQIRKPLGDDRLQAAVGRHEQLDDFYRIYCRNMRDLGTPPFPRSLFRMMLDEFPDAAEICTVAFRGRPAASGFLLHAPETTLIPSASSLRDLNSMGCNLLMYWHCLKRSIARGQATFDFGRSSSGSGSYNFKQQWGAVEHPANWQYCLRGGEVGDMRPSSGKYDKAIAAWQRLPVWVTQLIGPAIVRGIP